MNSYDIPDISHEVTKAIEEDVGDGDITAQLIPDSKTAVAKIICREAGVFCGGPWIKEVYGQLDEKIDVFPKINDGDIIDTDSVICEIHGPAKKILTGERTALNFVQTFSSVATLTRAYVNKIKGTSAKILDTRKTLPGLRQSLKYAVRVGGGTNHRMGLYDGVLIKENHILAAGGIDELIRQLTDLNLKVPIQIEVENLHQLQQAISLSSSNLILLDNFGIKDLEEAVKINRNQSLLEASGNITIDNVRDVANTGVDRISVGSLTKNISAIDLSMQFIY